MGNAGMSGFVSFLDAKDSNALLERSGLSRAPATVKQSDTVQPLRTEQDPTAVSQSHTAQEAITVKKSNTVRESKTPTVQQSNAVEESHTVKDSVPGNFRRTHVRRANAVEDGHSLAEEAVFRALWTAGIPEGGDPDSNRIVRIGYDRLAGIVRLSWVTVKANLRSLEKKLSIEVIAAEDSANREGKQYRVYSNDAILARRKSAGLLWVRRTRGVELLTQP